MLSWLLVRLSIRSVLLAVESVDWRMCRVRASCVTAVLLPDEQSPAQARPCRREGPARCSRHSFCVDSLSPLTRGALACLPCGGLLGVPRGTETQGPSLPAVSAEAQCPGHRPEPQAGPLLCTVACCWLLQSWLCKATGLEKSCLPTQPGAQHSSTPCLRSEGASPPWKPPPHVA